MGNTYNSDHIVLSVGNHYENNAINTDIIYTPNKGLNWYGLNRFQFSNIKVMIIGDETADKFSSIIVVIDETSVYATSTDNINFNNINTSEWFNHGTDGLPDFNISDIVYDNKDDVLYLSMYGRGVWKYNGSEKICVH